MAITRSEPRVAVHTPSLIEAAVNAVNSGPLGANGVPATVPGPKGTPVPFNPLKDIAFPALGQASPSATSSAAWPRRSPRRPCTASRTVR